MQKENILEMDFEELNVLMKEWGESAYRTRQVTEWIYHHGVRSFDAMTNLSKKLRTLLKERFDVQAVQIRNIIKSEDGSAKLQFVLGDGMTVEGVYMPDEKKKAFCVSTQVGCKFNCSFCLTGKMGFIRDLTASEIIDQVLSTQEWLGPENKLTNLVLMGMGEPLDNCRNTIKAVKIFNSTSGLKLGARKITLSTVGYLPGLRKFQEEGLKINLALSLNAVDDETRSRIMPINKKYPIREVLQFFRDYPLPPSRRVTMEYVLISGENDSEEDALKLTKLLRDMRSRVKVNLIPLNETGAVYPSISAERLERFHRILINAKFTVFTRKSRGQDIKGACGQLGGTGKKAWGE